MLDLESVHAKLARAAQHSQTIDAELAAWLYQDVRPYRLERQVNADLTRHSVVVRVIDPPPLTYLGVILGDAVHNLRSALDHLVYAISVHELNADPPPNEKVTAFLINDSPDDFRSKFFRIQKLSKPVQMAIDSVQTYNRRHAEMPPLLALLRDLDDADKHRLIGLGLSRPVEITFDKVYARREDVTFETFYGNLVDGFEIGAITLRHPNADLKFNCSVSVTVCAQHPTGPLGRERTGVDILVSDYLLPEVQEVVKIVASAVAP